jgi:hypothetical protein
MELDIYHPAEQLAFEYQGQHHYLDIYEIGSYWDVMQKDKDKRQACQENGIKLIEIPYWWDRKLQSLAATIYQHQPNLLSFRIVNGDPIPLQPAGGFPSGLWRILSYSMFTSCRTHT